MAESITLARPYAQASFNAAMEDKDLAAWEKMLGLLAELAKNEKVHAQLSSPSLSAEQQAATLISLAGEELSAKVQNLVSLLAENKRLVLLPEILEIFALLKANQEKTVDVELATAFALSDEVVDALTRSLKARLSREIKLQTVVDSHLIGGAVIRAGDTVIDNSIRGKLNKLAEAMNSQ